MRFMRIISIILVIFLLSHSSLWATKKFGRKTGWKCIQCHQSKKGGDKNLKEEGKNYLRYIQIRKNIRKARKNKKEFEIGSDEKEIVNFFKSVHKKARNNRKRNDRGRQWNWIMFVGLFFVF